VATALDIIKDAMEALGLLQAGEQPSASDAAYGLRRLNLMMDSWSTEALAIFCKRQDAFNLVANQQVYPLGVGGTLDINGVLIPRPEYLTYSWVRIQGQDTSVQILDQLTWDEIPLKNTPGTYPNRLFYDPQYPLGRLNVYPNPQVVYQMTIESMQQLAQFANVNQTVTLPPGYEKAMGENLALDLPSFGIEPSGRLVQIAGMSKSNIQRLNSLIHTNKMENDYPSQPTGIHAYNILTNRPSRP